MKENILNAPPKAKEQQKRTHCKCCKVPLAKSRMPHTMEGLLAWHRRWLITQARLDARGNVIFDEQLIFSSGYPQPKIEVLQDLWMHVHRELVGHKQCRRLVTDHDLVIRPKKIMGWTVNVAVFVTKRIRRVQSVPVFKRSR